jgi:hypothetical protein
MSNPIDRWLTAYVDGELTPEERQRVADLLREHPGLEVILRRLEADRTRLKDLGRQALPAEFPQTVLSEIRTRNIEIIRQRRRPALVRYFVPLSAAAAILVALGLTARHLILNHGKDGPVVVREHKHPVPVDQPKLAVNSPLPQPGFRPEVREAWERLVAGLPSTDEMGEQLGDQVNHYRLLLSELGNVLRVQTTQVVAGFRLTPEEADVTDSPFSTPVISTSPPWKASPFKTLNVKLPLFLDVRLLDPKQLLERLREDNVHHLDLSVLESWKAMERFQRACQASGVKVVLDAEAARRLSNKIPAVYLVYLEDVSPDQVAKLMQALQAEDVAAEKQKKGEGQFQSLMVQSLDDDGRKRLADALGVPAASLAPGAKPRVPSVDKPQPNGVDSSKPLSEETLKSLQKVAAGQGTRPGAKPGEPTAVAILWNPRLRTPLSKEVRELLDAKKPTSADGINVVFLFRPSRG